VFDKCKIVIVIVAFGALFTCEGIVGTAASAQNPAQDQATKEKKIAAGEAEARRLLLLMDTDKNGRVSKQEFMSFMEAEFDRLDKNKDGQLDVKELTKADVHVRSVIHR
jgi:hypothetical protein